MCGRYALYSNIEQIKSQFPIDQVACDSEPNYNVAPTQEVLAIVKQDGLNILDKPPGNRSKQAGLPEAFKKRRCLIPADGFYEWYRAKGQKQPCLFWIPHNVSGKVLINCENML